MLSDAAIRRAKATGKPLKLTDGGGLYLYVTPAGSKIWRQRYEVGGKERTLVHGAYPEVSLARARELRDAARQALREGRAPSIRAEPGADESSGPTLEKVAREWHAFGSRAWTPRHAANVLHTLERDVFPELGSRPIREITALEVLALMRKIEGRPALEAARRARQRLSHIFVFAISSGIAENDPAAIIQKAMAPMPKSRQPAVLDLGTAREVLRRAETTPARPVTRLALRLLALTALRPGTLSTTSWSELRVLDPDEPLWTVPAARMKLRLESKGDARRDRWVPLSRQAVEVIEVLRRLTGKLPYVFPNARHPHQPMSANALGYLLNRAGYHGHHVPHGWRSSFSTIMNERYPADRHIIDLMLAHVPKDQVEAAYNRAAYLTRRRELAQLWADLLLRNAPPAEALLEGPSS